MSTNTYNFRQRKVTGEMHKNKSIAANKIISDLQIENHKMAFQIKEQNVIIASLNEKIASWKESEISLQSTKKKSSNLNEDVFFEIIKNASADDLQSICRINKQFYELCKNNKKNLAKIFLDKYQVDYKDPSNFIYKFNKVNQDDYKNKNVWKIESLFKLYMKTFKIMNIECEKMEITSCPILPNMTHFYGDDNELTFFPIQPKMTWFCGSDNLLESFPIQPKMGLFSGENNFLTSFPIQPKMTDFICGNNELTSVPIQPKMTHFHGNDNQLTSFPIQPKMQEFYGDNNVLTSFPIQPKMVVFCGNNNVLTSFAIQPKMFEFEGKNNLLTNVPILQDRDEDRDEDTEDEDTEDEDEDTEDEDTEETSSR